MVLPTGTVTYEEALEHLFGGDADAILARRQVTIDNATRRKLLVESAVAILRRVLAGN